MSIPYLFRLGFVRCAAVVLCLFASLILISCGSDGGKVSIDIGPDGGIVISEDGRLVLTIPAGALTSTTNIEVQTIGNQRTASGRAYELSPDGLTFATPVRASLTLPDLSAGDDLPAVVLVNESGGVSEELANQVLDASGDEVTISGDLEHFSTVSDSVGAGLTLKCDPPNPVALSSQFDVPNIVLTQNSASQAVAGKVSFIDGGSVPFIRAIAPAQDFLMGFGILQPSAGSQQTHQVAGPPQYICDAPGPSGVFVGRVDIERFNPTGQGNRTINYQMVCVDNISCGGAAATPTPEPTASATPEPTSTPTGGEEEEEEATPTPTPEAEATATPTPTPEPIVEEDRGILLPDGATSAIDVLEDTTWDNTLDGCGTGALPLQIQRGNDAITISSGLPVNGPMILNQQAPGTFTGDGFFFFSAPDHDLVVILDGCDLDLMASNNSGGSCAATYHSVSYTHLTLPTSFLV